MVSGPVRPFEVAIAGCALTPGSHVRGGFM